MSWSRTASCSRYCDAIVATTPRRYGWSKRQRNDVIQSLRLLQVLQATPSAKIRASDVVQLPRYDGNITSTLDVLAEAGLLIDDVPPTSSGTSPPRPPTCPSR